MNTANIAELKSWRPDESVRREIIERQLRYVRARKDRMLVWDLLALPSQTMPHERVEKRHPGRPCSSRTASYWCRNTDSEYSTIISLCSDSIGARGHVSNVDAPVSVWWLLAHLSPLGWEHINLTGDYIWVAVDNASKTMTN